MAMIITWQLLVASSACLSGFPATRQWGIHGITLAQNCPQPQGINPGNFTQLSCVGSNPSWGNLGWDWLDA